MRRQFWIKWAKFVAAVVLLFCVLALAFDFVFSDLPRSPSPFDVAPRLLLLLLFMWVVGLCTCRWFFDRWCALRGARKSCLPLAIDRDDARP